MVQSGPHYAHGSEAMPPLVALQVTLQQMREQTDARLLIRLTLDYVKAVFVAPLIWLALYDYSNHQLVGQGGVTLLEDPTLLQAVHPLQPGEILEQVVIEQRPISLPDMSQEPRMGIWQREAGRLGGIQGCLIYPIRGQRRCLGVLMLGSQLWGVTTSEEEKALLGILLGQLAASLQQIENAWKQQTEKRLEDPLLTLGRAMRQAGSLEERVSSVIQELQSFIGAVRVEVYWHAQGQGQFVPRGRLSQASPPTQGAKPVATPASVRVVATQRFSDGGTESSGGLLLRDLGDMYYTLADGQVVVAHDATGATRSEITPKLMQRLRAQAVLAAPILLEKDLLGFICVQSDVPRTWQDSERQLVAAAGNWLALATPLEDLDQRIRQLADHQAFVQQVARSVYSQADLQQALQEAIVGLAERLQVGAVAVLRLDPGSQALHLVYEQRREGKQPLPKQFPPLSEQDWGDLMRSEVLVAENYDQDLRLLSWRQECAALGIRSLMLTYTGHVGEGSAAPTEGLILVMHQQLRAWKREERQLLRGIAQQLGVVLRQTQLEEARQRQAKLLQGLISLCSTLQNLSTPTEIYTTTVQQTAQLLGIPLALLVTWQPGASQGQLQPPFATAPEFQPNGPTEIDLQDPLLAYALQAVEPLPLTQEEIPPISRTWLNTVGLGSWLLMPLGSGGDLLAPLGVLILGAEAGKSWDPDDQGAVMLIAQTCCWTLRRLLWMQTLQERQEVLSELNWYKQRRLLDMQNTLLESLRRLGQVPETAGNEVTRWQKVVEIGRGLRDLATSTEPLLQLESWQVQPQSVSVPLAALVRKGLRRVEGLTQKRKLWPRVHGDMSIAVQGDSGRLEMILWEVLMAAAQRSPEGGRLDLWSQVSEGYVELLVVDQGHFDPNLMVALQWDAERVIYADPLLKSPLTVSPGLELGLCQRVIQRMGGQLSFYQSTDGRCVSRLLLPLGNEEFSPVG
ncbi:MAG: GAF domain-containing protein [Thermostichus sp. DG_1_6_bins_120]